MRGLSIIIVIFGQNSFYTPFFLYFNTKMNIIFFENPHWEILPIIVKKKHGKAEKSQLVFIFPEGDANLYPEIFSRL